MADKARDRVGTRLVLKSNGTVRFVSIDEVSWAESAGHYVRLHVAGIPRLYRSSMSDFCENLPEVFLRVHRSYVVRTDLIVEFRRKTRARDWTIVLRDGTVIPVGRTYLASVKSELGIRR